MTGPAARRTWHPIQKAVLWVAGVFVALGALGFVPGITAGAAVPELAGADSRMYLFGVFHVSIVHNVVHLATGLLALLAVGRPLRLLRPVLPATDDERDVAVQAGSAQLDVPVLHAIDVGAGEQADLRPPVFVRGLVRGYGAGGVPGSLVGVLMENG